MEDGVLLPWKLTPLSTIKHFNLNKIMKKLYILMATVLGLSAFASCQKEEAAKYLQLETGSYTFDYRGNERLGIVVHSNCEWEAKTAEDWIGIIERVEDTLFVTVKENADQNSRSGKVTFSASDAISTDFIIDQLGTSFRGKFYDFSEFTKDVAVSRNGKFAAGLKRIGNESSRYNPVIINLETGERTELAEVNNWNSVRFISNDGNTICLSLSEGATYNIFPIDYENKSIGDEIVLALPDGYVTAKGVDISSDGNIIVGYCYDKRNSNRITPAKWVNFEPVILEQNEINIFGTNNEIGGMARGCNDDGSVIYGSDWGSYGTTLWVDEALTYVGALPGYNEVTEESGRKRCSGIIKTAEYQSVSPNGKYLAATYRNLNQSQFPCMVNTETLEVTVMNIDGLGTTCSDNGTLFAGNPSFGGCTKGYATEEGNGNPVSISEWFKNKYGIDIQDDRIILQETDNYIYGYKVAISNMTGGILTKYFCFIPEK